MNGPRLRIRLAAVLALAIPALAPPAAAAEVRGEIRGLTGRNEVTVVASGAVSWVAPPRHLGLDGGWTVELADAAPWLDELACRVAQGEAPRVKVVGSRDPGSAERLVRAASAELLAGRASASSHEVAASGGRSERSRSVWRITGAAGGGIAVEPEIEDDETTLRGYLLSFTADGF